MPATHFDLDQEPTVTNEGSVTPAPRPIVVVDVETNGLNLETHQVVEVAWWNLSTDERGCFVPIHDVSEVLAKATVRALQVNRYIDRLAEAAQDTDYVELNRLHDQLDGATLLGSNPRIDAAMLAKMFADGGRLRTEPWHYRLWDIGAYAAGVLGLDLVPGLWDVCEALGIPHGDHTAEGDVTATGLCFRALQQRAARLCEA